MKDLKELKSLIEDMNVLKEGMKVLLKKQNQEGTENK